MTTILKTQRKTPGSERESKRIAKGEPVTRDYREFCARMDVDLLKGVEEPSHPHPFALRKPMKCKLCPWIAEAARLEEEDSWVCTLAERRGPDGEPAEYVQVCVECGARDSFEPAPLCAECDAYPCVCQEGETNGE